MPDEVKRYAVTDDSDCEGNLWSNDFGPELQGHRPWSFVLASSYDALKAERDHLRAALEPYVKNCTHCHGHGYAGTRDVDCFWCRPGRAALLAGERGAGQIDANTLEVGKRHQFKVSGEMAVFQCVKCGRIVGQTEMDERCQVTP